MRFCCIESVLLLQVVPAISLALQEHRISCRKRLEGPRDWDMLWRAALQAGSLVTRISGRGAPAALCAQLCAQLMPALPGALPYIAELWGDSAPPQLLGVSVPMPPAPPAGRRP